MREGVSVAEDSPSSNGTLKRELYFPTSIYFKDLPDGAALNAAVTPHLYAWREADREGITRSNVKEAGSWHSDTGMATRPEYRPLVDRLLTVAAEIFDDLGYHSDWQPVIDNMWANISPRYGFNRAHSHPQALWSGVYYVQTPASAGRLYFMEPRAQVLVQRPVYGRAASERPESWTEVYFEPVAGRLILFPAWLVHEVEPNMSDVEGPAGDRISVSFNLMQRRIPRPSEK